MKHLELAITNNDRTARVQLNETSTERRGKKWELDIWVCIITYKFAHNEKKKKGIETNQGKEL